MCDVSFWGVVVPSRRGMSPETEASHANFSSVSLTTSQRRDPPLFPRGGATGEAAQGGIPTVPINSTENIIEHPRGASKELTRTSRTQFYIPLCLPNHRSTDQIAISLRSSIAVSPSLNKCLRVASGLRQSPKTCTRYQVYSKKRAMGSWKMPALLEVISR